MAAAFWCAAAVCGVVSTAQASATCPSTSLPPFFNKIILYDALQYSSNATVHIGRIKNFFGTGVDVLGACVQDIGGLNIQRVHVITTEDGQLLAGLPGGGDSHLCLGEYFGGGEGAASVDVIWESSRIECGIEFTSFNYAGASLVTYTGSGGNHFHGGGGIDIVYGGSGGDDLNEDVHESGFPTSLYGAIYAEEGNDFLVGQYSNSTLLRGGTHIDKFYDGGGNNDRLFGDEGDDCCIFDRGHVFAALAGGSGRDGVKNLAGTQTCEYIQTLPACTMLVARCQ